MSKQDEILGKHPSADSYMESWLDYEDKEPTQTSCIRVLSEKNAFDKTIIETFSKILLDYHYSPVTIVSLKSKFEKLGFHEFATYYTQSRKLPQNRNTQKGNAVEILMTEYCLAAINKLDMTYVHRFRYNPNVDQSMKGDDMLIVDFSDDASPTVYLGEAKFRKTVDNAVLNDVKRSLAKDKLPLSLTFLRDRFENVDDDKYEKLDNMFIRELSDFDIRYIGFIVGDKNASKKVVEKWECDNPKHLMLVLSLDEPEKFVEQAFGKAKSLLTKIPEKR